ncbi:hypothetical protein GDO81_018856 [Engystomops pustulosus]|uniref:Uncharacterized protein n=1 Tax=Engystomops pustulosus TaxID=76066 RepID=A0AAV6YGD2_ENGPU|nr:hypothetical protein GDO81_018856 [Engystomops pustulosus]
MSVLRLWCLKHSGATKTDTLEVVINPFPPRPFFDFAFSFFTPHIQKSVTFLFFHVQSYVTAYFLRNKLHFKMVVFNIPCHVPGKKFQMQ